MPYEVFEHTADVGLHVTGASLEELFADAGHGLMSLIVDNPHDIRQTATVQLELEGDEIDELFADWLRELLFRFETEHLLCAAFSIRLTDGNRRLHAECRGEPVDWTRHEPGTEVKAITEHQLRVERTASGWEARVILDI